MHPKGISLEYAAAIQYYVDNYIGQSHFRLTAKSVIGRMGKKFSMYLLCSCECGKYSTLSARKWGYTKSCGCLRTDKVELPNWRTKEYRAWYGAIRRCLEIGHKDYHSYGGRGISVCDRWLGKNGFSHFKQDMGPRPLGRFSLDRINVNGNYEPNNCRWATDNQQARNKRCNAVATHNGKTLTIADWSDATGIPFTTLYQRILKMNWPVEVALTTPVLKLRRKMIWTRNATDKGATAIDGVPPRPQLVAPRKPGA